MAADEDCIKHIQSFRLADWKWKVHEMQIQGDCIPLNN